jgi:transmembrane sensor
MNHSMSPELLARYLAAEATPEERAAVEAWAAAADANRRELGLLRSAWQGAPPTAWDVDRAWQRVASQLDAPVVRELPRHAPALRRVLQLAAAVLVVAGVGFAWRTLRRMSVVASQVFATAAGEQREVDLPDGTHVSLAATSTLRVNAGYGAPDRRVELTGEAIFSVRHDETHPFEVRAASALVRDIGTTFSVRARAGDPGVRVAVLDGIASLRDTTAGPGTAVRLSARDVGLLLASGPVEVRHDVAVQSLVSWRDGRLTFEDAPLGSVLAELSAWFGTPFRVADTALARRRLTATLSTTSIADALQVLSLSLGVHTEHAGDTVIVR